MAELALYDVTVRGYQTQMQLTAEDAAELGATKVGTVQAAVPQPAPTQPWSPAVDDSGAVIQTDQDADASAETSAKKAPAPRNKARTAPTK